MNFATLAIILPACIMLHVTEEFLFPGGFIEWYQELVPSKAAGIRPGYLVWINTLMIGVCVLPVALGASYRGIGIWYTPLPGGISVLFIDRPYYFYHHYLQPA